MIFSRCERCGRRALLPRKRVYKISHVGVATSQKKLCGHCYRGIRKINKELTHG